MREDAAIVEVFGNVARLTTRKAALLSLCLVSRAAHAGAARWLYQDVELSRTLRAFCFCVSQSPKLASYVHALSIVNAGLSDPTTRLLTDTLKRLPNLRTIALPPLEHVLSRQSAFGDVIAALPRLESVVLQRAGDLTQTLSHKLPQLRSLQLHFGLQSLGDLHPDHGCGRLLLLCQPSLEVLNIHGFDLASFLEPRTHVRWPRVRSLTLLSTTNIDEILVAAFPNVEELVLRDLDFPAELLCDSRVWPRLRQLTLSVPNLIDGDPDVGGRVRVLDRFSVWNTHMVDPDFITEQLRYYDLGRLAALQFYSGYEFSPSLICTIFSSCPNLRLLGIRFDSMKSAYTEILQAGEGPKLEFLSVTLSNYVLRPPDSHPIEVLGRHFPRLRIVDFIVMRTAAVQWRISHDPVQVALETDAELTSIQYWEMAVR